MVLCDFLSHVVWYKDSAKETLSNAMLSSFPCRVTLGAHRSEQLGLHQVERGRNYGPLDPTYPDNSSRDFYFQFNNGELNTKILRILNLEESRKMCPNLPNHKFILNQVKTKMPLVLY